MIVIKNFFTLVVLFLVMVCNVQAEGESPVISGVVLQDFTMNGEKPDSSCRLVLKQESFDSHTEIRDVVSGSFTLQELILQNSDSVVNYAGDENVPIIKADNSALDISKAVLLADFKELYIEKDGVRIEATKVEATWEVPSLNRDLGSVHILHYSYVRDNQSVLC